MYVSKERLIESKKIGNKAELLFKKIIISNGFEWEKSDDDEDIKGHFDCRIKNKKGKIFKVEVKAKKKKNSTDKLASPNDIWIEIVGGTGYKGWIYGESHFIAFELDNEQFIMAKRKDLVKFIEKKIAENEFKMGKGYYEIHTRGVDKVILTKLEDIKKEMETKLIK